MSSLSFPTERPAAPVAAETFEAGKAALEKIISDAFEAGKRAHRNEVDRLLASAGHAFVDKQRALEAAEAKVVSVQRRLDSAQNALAAQRAHFGAMLATLTRSNCLVGQTALVALMTGSWGRDAVLVATLVNALSVLTARPNAAAHVVRRRNDGVGVEAASRKRKRGAASPLSAGQSDPKAAAAAALGATQRTKQPAVAGAQGSVPPRFAKRVLVQLLGWACGLQAMSPCDFAPGQSPHIPWRHAPVDLYAAWAKKLAAHFKVSEDALPETLTYYSKTLSRLHPVAGKSTGAATDGPDAPGLVTAPRCAGAVSGPPAR